MASASACRAWPGLRRRPPMASIASQNAPAPRPSSTRPPLSRSRLATERASTAGGRRGGVGPVGGQVHPAGPGGHVAEQGPGVQERRLVGVVLKGHQVQPHLLGQHGQADRPLGIGAGRTDERAEQQRMPVVGHRDLASLDRRCPVQLLRARYYALQIIYIVELLWCCVILITWRPTSRAIWAGCSVWCSGPTSRPPTTPCAIFLAARGDIRC